MYFKKPIIHYLIGCNWGSNNDDLTKTFEEIALNKTGYLLDKVWTFMHAMDPTIADKDIVELLNFIDMEEDGKLNYKEFKQQFRQLQVTTNT